MQWSCLFLPRNALLALALQRAARVNQGSVPMTFAGRLQVVMAYATFVFVGAIVLGMI